MKDVSKVSLTLTSPVGRTRVITAVSLNASQKNANFSHSDADMGGDVVTIYNGSTAGSYEVVVRKNSGNHTFLKNFYKDCVDEGDLGTGLYKNTSVKGNPETYVLTGVSIAQVESGQDDNSNTDVTFTVLYETRK